MNFKVAIILSMALAISANAQEKQKVVKNKTSTQVSDTESAGNGEIATPAPSTRPSSEMVMKGINVGAFYSTANSIDIKGSISGIGVNAKYQTDSAPGLSARYAYVQSNNIGFLGGASYSFNRKIKSVDVTATVDGNSTTFHSDFTEDAGLSLLTLEPNATFGIAQNFYLLAGPNYVIPFKTGKWDKADIKSDLGAQFGGGFAVNGFFAEAQYQTLNPRIDIPKLSTDESHLWGFIFRAGATF